MIALKLAYRNLVGAGIRTWLNVFVLSIAYVLIIYFNGLMSGWNREARRDTINWEIANGQYWQKDYDPYDPFSFNDSHSAIPSVFNSKIDEGKIVPILISEATIYPEGRIQSIVLKGISTNQKILKLPTYELNVEIAEIPGIIGKRFSKNTNLKKDDLVTVRWRDANGTFDAAEIRIISVFNCNVPTVDNGQIWIPLDDLQKMKQMPDEATILVNGDELKVNSEIVGWVYKDIEFLVMDITKIIKTKRIGSSFFYIIILALAMLAIFDTQVLSIFKRQKEIGTYVAMGMTRKQVVTLFTVEGAFHAVLAAIVGAIYGIPILAYVAKIGFKIPEGSDDMGLAMADVIYPFFSLMLIVSTIILVFLITTIVSYLPARKISKMEPTDAIKGKIQ
ncbi:MAG: ABC transporter permease [Bacteroidetes bacterium GWF2_33_16]|nr:MAG: ABC transporter permease [Bacteroidetes bacterium GWE2_32_14]OFY06041.1 MAG: ABC transporter permease [Bacteroidetes bacterium GWF2_33_16]